MPGYNLVIDVNDGEYVTALRLDDSIDHLKAMKRAFWAVQKEFFPNDTETQGSNDNNLFVSFLHNALNYLDQTNTLLQKRADLIEGDNEFNIELRDLLYNTNKFREKALEQIYANE